MNILYIEKNKEIIKLISKECDKSYHQIFLLSEYKDALIFLKETNDIDLIIIDLDSKKIDTKNYLKKIRNIDENMIIIVTSQNELELSFDEYQFLNIKNFLKKPFKIENLKELIKKVEKEKKCLTNKLENKSLLEKQYTDLLLINEELNLILKPFKEFSFYSETDLNGVITEISDSFCDLIGYKKDEIIGKKHSILKHPLEKSNKYIEIWESISNGKNWIGELRCKDKFGNDIWYKTIIFPKKNKNKEIVAYAAKRQDITEKKRIELLSITNDLTGLYNKRFFKQTFLNEISRSKRNNKNLIFLMLDVDYFKKYNDTYGHLKGDIVLKEVAEVLKMNTKRANDFAFRLGGEEFAILTSNLSVQKTFIYAEKIRNNIQELRIINENSEHKYLTVSVGIFILDVSINYSIDEIYKFADIALYKAKNSGRNKVIIYNNIY